MATKKTYWVRLKPYNPQRNCRMQRCFWLGRVWTGGDGIWEVPEWVECNPAQAAACKPLRQSGFQKPQGPNDPRAFDIVTLEMKQEIDRRENEYRMRARGIGVPAVTQMPNVGPAEVPLAEPVKRLTMEDLEDADDPEEDILPQRGDPLLSVDDDGIDDAEEEGSLASVGTIGGALNVSDLEPKEVSIAGRAAAADGFEQDEGLDLNDDTDVNDVAPAADDSDFESTAPDAVPAIPTPKAPVPKAPPRSARRGK